MYAVASWICTSAVLIPESILLTNGTFPVVQYFHLNVPVCVCLRCDVFEQDSKTLHIYSSVVCYEHDAWIDENPNRSLYVVDVEDNSDIVISPN